MSMIEVSMDEIDDPVFDLTHVAFERGLFSLEGYVDLSRGKLLSGRRIAALPEGAKKPAWVRHRLLFRASGVTSFEIEDEAGLGELILESIVAQPGIILLTGVVPCTIKLHTMDDSWSRLELGSAFEDGGR